MKSNHDIRVAFAGLMIVLTLGVLAGCGGSEADAGGEPARPTVDPRYATVDAFVDYINELNTSDPVRIHEIRREIRTESPEQERLLESYDFLMASVELELAAARHIPGYESPEDMEEVFAPSEPARITERLGRRAIATYRDSTGHEEQLHFVELDGRWWISGYTLEYSQAFTETEALMQRQYEAMGLDRSERAELMPKLRQLTDRINRGEFGSQQEFFAAVMEEFAPGAGR